MPKSKRYKLLQDINSVSFAALELTLFLDTHPDDRAMWEQRKTYLKERECLIAEYEDRYGPLTQNSPGDFPWNWIDEPWPWEMTPGGDD